MPPIESPTTALTWSKWRTFVTSWSWLFTISRMVIFGNFMRGCRRLFEGEAETPLLRESIATTK